jgi:hypothetical protein
MRTSRVLLVGSLVLVGSATFVSARCGDDPDDEAEVVTARSEIEATCNCGASKRGAYTRCAKGIARRRSTAGNLSSACAKTVVRCASRSTCGRPRFVACCRPGARGPRCGVAKSAAKCAAHGGCASTAPSCCDACTPKGCVISTTTTTTMPLGLTGDWIFEGAATPNACPPGGSSDFVGHAHLVQGADGSLSMTTRSAMSCFARLVDGGFDASCLVCPCAVGCGEPFGGYEPYIYVHGRFAGSMESLSGSQTSRLNYFTGTPSSDCSCPHDWTGIIRRVQ